MRGNGVLAKYYLPVLCISTFVWKIMTKEWEHSNSQSIVSKYVSNSKIISTIVTFRSNYFQTKMTKTNKYCSYYGSISNISLILVRHLLYNENLLNEKPILAA